MTLDEKGGGGAARTARAMQAEGCAVALEEGEQHSERNGGSAVVAAVAADEDAPASVGMQSEAASGGASRWQSRIIRQPSQ